MKYSFLSLGCKVNQAESLEWERTVAQQGHKVVSLDDMPDICVINTCTVTGKSDYESRRLIRRAHKTGAKIVVTGCYSQLNRELVTNMDGVETVVDNSEKEYIISKISHESLSPDAKEYLGEVIEKGSRTRKFLKIQDGCEYSCTYCLVWQARGSSRSSSPKKVIDQVKEALDDGYQEIVLTGIHLGLYGKDLDKHHTLTALISDIISNTSASRIRVSSLEVNEIDDVLLDLIREGHVCKHLHIPLQSGDNNVLKAMSRNYSREFFRDRVLEIHDYVGDIAIGTDIIAGFPSESEKSFQNSVKLAEELPFTYLHVFPYSARPGTIAAGLEDMVGDEERKRRASRLRQISRQKKKDYLVQQVGKKISALIERCQDDGLCVGTSDNYLKVVTPYTPGIKGNIVPLQITKVEDDHLFGNLLE